MSQMAPIPQKALMNWIHSSSSFIIILLMILCPSFYMIDESEISQMLLNK